MNKTELKQIAEALKMALPQWGQFMLDEIQKVQTKDVLTKDLNSLVSYVDQEVEYRIIKLAQSLLPQANFIAEESGQKQSNSPWRWIIDPLDGTTNYLHQLPFFSISIALQYEEKTVLGMVYEPNRKDLFWAIEGQGAYLNEQPLQLSSAPAALSDSLLATGFPYYDFEQTKAYLALLGELMPACRGLRRCGSAALDLAYTAAGRFGGFYEYSLAPWDVAAGAFLVQEAGGFVCDFSGQNDYLFGREILAGQKGLQSTLLSKIQKHFKA